MANFLPNGCVIKNSYCFLPDLQTMQLWDKTGAYDSVLNPTGYGNGSNSSNVSVQQCLTSVINLQPPDQTSFFCDYNPTYPVNLLPTIPTTGAVPFAVLSNNIGLAPAQNLPIGIWKGYVVETFGQLVGWTSVNSSATIHCTQTAHGYSTGQVITVFWGSDETTVPLGNFTITVTGANTYTYNCGLSAGGNYSGTLVTSAPNQYQLTNTFYLLNTVYLWQQLDLYAISICDCDCCDDGYEKVQKYEWIKFQLEQAEKLYCDGLYLKSAEIIAIVNNWVNCNIKCNNNC